MKHIRMAAFSFIAAALIAGIIASPNQALAEKPPFFDHLYLMKEAQLYNSPEAGQKPIAALSAGQVVTVVDSDVQENSRDQSPKWYLVKTWIGDKWVKADYNAIYSGRYDKADRVATLAMETPLYDYPGTQATALRIAPQKVRITAYFDYVPASFSSATSFLMSSERWYQIDTWIGKKWIREPSLLEDIKPEPVDYQIKLLEAEKIYLMPFYDEGKSETFDPQVIQVTGTWTTGWGPGETTWLRIELPQGERWVVLTHPALTDYRTMNETITLLTETRYFDKNPWAYPSEGWLAPGEYEAFEASGDYIHIRTDQGDVWVNLSRALLERPLGIEQVDMDIQLTEDSEYFRFPAAGEISHAKGFYAPQTVRAYERWVNEDGQVFYHFRSFSGDEWVLVP